MANKLPNVPLQDPDSRRHRLGLATAVNELIKVRPPNDRTAAEIAAGVTPSDYAGSSRPWTDAALRYGLNGDGSTDNADAFARMCSVGGQALLIKRGDYVCSESQDIPAGTTIYFEPGTIIRDGGELPDQAFWRIDDVSNVHIIGWGAKILMDRDDYTADEQRHGLRIRGDCENIRVEGLESSNTGGDGFYVGSSDSSSGVPTNVYLIGLKGDNNRRQGLSIQSARHLRVIDCQFTNTDGTSPESGIDIEPDSATDVLDDIVIRNVRTEDNEGSGILIHLANLDDTSEPISIDIYNHTDVGSRIGAIASSGLKDTRGYVRFHSPIWQENTLPGFMATNWEASGVLCEVIDPIVIDCNQGDASSATLSGSAYAVVREVGSLLTDPIGGVHIYRPSVRVTGDIDPLVGFYVQNNIQTGDVEDVKIIDPKEVVYSSASTNWQGGAEVYFRDTLGVLRRDSSLSREVGQFEYYSIESNDGATGAINLDLTDWTVTGTERTFEVRTAQSLRIRADQSNAALRIFPGGYTSLQCDEVGGRLTLRRDEGGFWVTNMVGVWRASSSTFAISNETSDYAFDADTVAVAELADVVATLIKDLRRGS